MSGRPCHHEWSTDYTCTACGAIKYASAPLWAWCEPMASGPRGVWLALWSCADRETTAPDDVYPSNGLLAQRAGGISPRSVQRHLDALAAMGRISVSTRDGRRYIRLAWASDRADRTVVGRDNIVAQRDDPVAGASATILSPDATILTDEATILSPTPDNIVTHTLELPCSTLQDLGSSSQLLAHLPADEHPEPDGGLPPSTSPPAPRSGAEQQPPAAKPKRRRSSAPRAGQAALPGVAEQAEPDVVAELLAEHERVRAEAMAAHGERVTGWPGKASKLGASMRAGVRQALRERTPEQLRAMLAWLGERWRGDATELAYSVETVWRPSSITRVHGWMSSGATRSRPARKGLLSAPAPVYDAAVHEYTPPECGEEMEVF